MNKILTGVLILLVAVVAGCSTKIDGQMTTSHMTAEVLIAQAKAEAIKAQADAIRASIHQGSSDLEAYLARESIASLEVTESGIKAPKTGNDVALAATRQLKDIVKYGVGGVIGYKVADGVADALKNGGTTEITAEGDVTNVREENHATNFGKNGNAAMTRSEDDYSVKTEIIKEEKPEEEEDEEETPSVEEPTED